jgi:hypothetical protein
MASKSFGAEMASERWSLESTVINTSSVTVVEGEAGEGAICGGVSYTSRFKSRLSCNPKTITRRKEEIEGSRNAQY